MGGLSATTSSRKSTVEVAFTLGQSYRGVFPALPMQTLVGNDQRHLYAHAVISNGPQEITPACYRPHKREAQHALRRPGFNFRSETYANSLGKALEQVPPLTRQALPRSKPPRPVRNGNVIRTARGT